MFLLFNLFKRFWIKSSALENVDMCVDYMHVERWMYYDTVVLKMCEDRGHQVKGTGLVM